MSEQSDFDALTQHTLATAQTLRDQSITEGARLAVEADDRLMAKGGAESRLAEEVVRLTARMEWLYRHPNLSRFLGGAAVKPVYVDDSRYYGRPAIETPIILENGVTVDGEYILTGGYIFGRTIHSVSRSTGDQRLHVFRAVKDRITGHEERTKPYELFWYTKDDGHGVQVMSQSFEDHKKKAREEQIAIYTAANPWAVGFDIGEGYISPHWKLPADATPKDLGKYALIEKERSRIHKELMPRLQPGKGGDYPDELYYEPLGLVLQANDLLNSPQLKK